MEESIRKLEDQSRSSNIKIIRVPERENRTHGEEIIYEIIQGTCVSRLKELTEYTAQWMKRLTLGIQKIANYRGQSKAYNPSGKHTN